MNEYTEIQYMRMLSTVFSRTAFQQVLKYSFYGEWDSVYAAIRPANKQVASYSDYLSFAYSQLKANYPNEYVLKTELINDLLKSYGTRHTQMFSEFRVGSSRADIVFFNGKSKAFEIKTELDSPYRLHTQLEDYCRLFDECYIVVPNDKIEDYKNVISDNIGIIGFSVQGRKTLLTEYRPATHNTFIDVDILMQSVRAKEFINIIESYFGYNLQLSAFNIYDTCHDLLTQIPADQLSQLFSTQMKKRKSSLAELKKAPRELRQMCLSLHLSGQQMQQLNEKLSLSIV